MPSALLTRILNGVILALPVLLVTFALALKLWIATDII